MKRKTHKKPTQRAEDPQVPVYHKICPDCHGYGGGCTVCETCGGSGLVPLTGEKHSQAMQQSEEVNRE